MAWLVFAAILAVWVALLALCLRALARPAAREMLQWSRLLASHFAAERRANALVRTLLTAGQLQQLRRHGYLEVASPSIPTRVYRVPGAGGLVRVYESGHAIIDLCLQSVDALPDGDVIIMHKLMIEGNEQEYLAKANHFAPGIISLRMGYL